MQLRHSRSGGDEDGVAALRLRGFDDFFLRLTPQAVGFRCSAARNNERQT